MTLAEDRPYPVPLTLEEIRAVKLAITTILDTEDDMAVLDSVHLFPPKELLALAEVYARLAATERSAKAERKRGRQ